MNSEHPAARRPVRMTRGRARPSVRTPSTQILTNRKRLEGSSRGERDMLRPHLLRGNPNSARGLVHLTHILPRRTEILDVVTGPEEALRGEPAISAPSLLTPSMT